MVVPCYNEEFRFPLDYWAEIIDVTEAIWFFVDDGSTDGTLKILNKLVSQKVYTVSLPINSGKSEAIRKGFLEALKRTEFDIASIGYLDCDGAFSLEDIKSFLELARTEEQYAMLWSSRVCLAGSHIERSNARHYIGRAISTFLWTGTPAKIYDTQAGLKIFRNKSFLPELLEKEFKTKWFVDLEIYIRWLNFENSETIVREVPVKYWKEVGGSKVRISTAPSILKELFGIRKGLRKALKNGS
jgi:glycosyltransferase involved in cell wall biosynthesis